MGEEQLYKEIIWLAFDDLYNKRYKQTAKEWLLDREYLELDKSKITFESACALAGFDTVFFRRMTDAILDDKIDIKTYKEYKKLIRTELG